jgi:hypothetical protein
MRKYQHKDFEIDVALQSGFSWRRENERASTGYVVVVTISRMGAAVSTFSPLRLGDSNGKSFSSDTDGLMVGYSAARRIVDDLLGADTDRR